MNQQNATQRYLVIPDIHGHNKALKRIVKRLRQVEAEYGALRLVFLGDYIDDGPDSLGVLDTLIEIHRRRPETTFLLGNHEFEAMRNEWRSIAVNEVHVTDERHRYFLSEVCRPYFVSDSFLFIHGSPRSSREDLEKADLSGLLWNYGHCVSGWQGRTVIRGHSSVCAPSKFDSTWFLDCDARHTGELVCCIFEEGNTDPIGIVASSVRFERSLRKELFEPKVVDEAGGQE